VHLLVDDVTAVTSQHALVPLPGRCVVTWSLDEWLTFNLQKWKRKARASSSVRPSD